MSHYARAIFGGILLIVGAVKAWSHVSMAGTMIVPGCFGRDFLIQVDAPVWQSVHCWGCYLALAGALILLLPFLSRQAGERFLSNLIE